MADITILDALIISLIGFAIVFAVLIILMCVVTLMGLAADKGQQPEAADADRKPARRGTEDDETEPVKVYRQARLGEKTDAPQPDCGKDGDTRDKVPALSMF